MQENSFEWFNAQVQNARNHADSWPTWMKNTSDVATASFPVVNGAEKKKGAVTPLPHPKEKIE
jgi:hypothetical protein